MSISPSGHSFFGCLVSKTAEIFHRQTAQLGDEEIVGHELRILRRRSDCGLYPGSGAFVLVQAEVDPSTVLAFYDQTRPLELFEMGRHGGWSKFENFGDLADAEFSRPEHGRSPQPGGVAQGPCGGDGGFKI